MNIVYRVPKAGVWFWYVSVIAIGGLATYVIWKLNDGSLGSCLGVAPLAVCSGILLILCLKAPTAVIPGVVYLRDDGIGQTLLSSRWFLLWSEIEQWSHVEISDVEGVWTPYVFIRRQNDRRIYYAHQWIVWGRRNAEIAAVLNEKCGHACNATSPVIADELRSGDWRLPAE